MKEQNFSCKKIISALKTSLHESSDTDISGAAVKSSLKMITINTSLTLEQLVGFKFQGWLKGVVKAMFANT